MVPVHSGRLLKREMAARELAANGLARALRVPPGRIIDIVNGKRATSAETALRRGRYFGNGGRFWLAPQTRYDLTRKGLQATTVRFRPFPTPGRYVN